MNAPPPIPAGWEVRPIRDLGQVVGGKRLPSGHHLTATPTPFPYVRVVDMYPGGVNLADLHYVPVVAAPAIRRYRIARGDIFVSVAGTLGIVGKIAAPLDCPNLTENADRITSLSCDPDYLMYALMSAPIQSEIKAIRTVGAQPKLALSRLKNFSILLPASRIEQTRIAESLKDADNLCNSLEQLIAKKEAMRQGAMQQLLSGRTRLQGFSDTWSVYRLDELGAFLKGRGIKRDDVRISGVACIRYGELYTTFRDYTSITASFVEASVAAAALPIQRGDLLFAGSGETRDEIGKCVAFTGTQPAVAGGDIIVFRAPSVNPVYLSSLLNMPKYASQKARRGQGDAVVHIGSRALGTIEVDVPSSAEQDAIADALAGADRELRALEIRLAKAKAIKQGMMQELLTGRTRLPVKEGAPA